MVESTKGSKSLNSRYAYFSELDSSNLPQNSNYDSVFYGKYENERGKNQGSSLYNLGKNSLTFPNGDLNPRFLSKFPPKI